MTICPLSLPSLSLSLHHNIMWRGDGGVGEWEEAKKGGLVIKRGPAGRRMDILSMRLVLLISGFRAGQVILPLLACVFQYIVLALPRNTSITFYFFLLFFSGIITPQFQFTILLAPSAFFPINFLPQLIYFH